MEGWKEGGKDQQRGREQDGQVEGTRVSDGEGINDRGMLRRDRRKRRGETKGNTSI